MLHLQGCDLGHSFPECGELPWAVGPFDPGARTAGLSQEERPWGRGRRSKESRRGKRVSKERKMEEERRWGVGERKRRTGRE